MDDRLQDKIRFLRAASIEKMPHTERGLLEHLLGTRQLLVEWGARAVVCDAGLFHSVYGTEHYKFTVLPISMRAEVRQVIGEEAESLVWLFCMMRRETFDENLQCDDRFRVQERSTGEWLPLTSTQFQDLVTMTFANTLEAFPRLNWQTRRTCRDYLRPFRDLAIPGAQGAFDRLDAPSWKFWK